MIKKLCFLLFLLLPFGTNQAPCQQTPGKIRVTVVPMINTQKDERLDVITQTVTDTVSLYLKLMRKYRVFIKEDIDPYMDLDGVIRYTKENGIDNVIFGKAYLGTEGEIVFEMSVYDRYNNSVVLTKREIAKSIFDIFDASDKLSVSLVESFSGVHLGFGNIVLKNTGEKGDFTLFLDGELLGKNILRVEKVINGMHLVEILQDRLLGEELIFQGNVEVIEDEEAELEFSIPYLLDKEQAELEKRGKRIVKNLERREERDNVRKEFEELLDLLKDTSFCYRLKEEYERYWQMREDWLVKASRWEIEDSFFTIGNPEYIELFRELKEAYEATEREDIRRGIEKEANLLYNTLGIHAAYQFSKKNWEKGMKLYRDIERMKNSIPCTNYYNFDQESEYVHNIYREYRSMKKKNPHDAESYIQREISNYFGRRMNTVRELFRSQTQSSENELLLLTDPMGMKVWVDGKFGGFSPLRISTTEPKKINIQIRDPWFEAKETVLNITPGRNLYLISSSWKKEAEFLDYKSPVTKIAHIKSKGKYELGWKKMKNAVSYIVYISISDENRGHSIYKRLAVNQNRYVFSHLQKPYERSSYMVLAVNENDIKSHWSNEKGFEGIPIWDFKTHGEVYSSAAIGRDKTSYFGSTDGSLYAVDRNGNRLWRFKTEGPVYSSAAIGRYGNIYFGSTDSFFYALNPDGTLLWKFETDGPIYSSPAVDVGETAYFVSWDGYLYAVSMEGRLKWKTPVGSKISSPAIDAGGIIYVGNNEGELYAINPDGTLKWKLNTKKPALTSPAIGADGTIYVGSKYGNILAIDQKGDINWSYDTGGVIASPPVIGTDETIYVNSMDLRILEKEMKELNNKLFALTDKGRLKWKYNALGRLASSPAVGSDGLLYIGNGKGVIFAIDSQGNVKWSFTLPGAVTSSPAISADGTLYIGTRLKRLYAVSTISKGAASSSWPIFGKNIRHTSSAQTEGDEGRVPYRLITVDGDSTDWYGVKPAIVDPVDPASDQKEAYPGTDIDKVYLAMDSKRLYTKIDLKDGPPDKSSEGYYRIGLESLDKYSLLSINYDKGWQVTLKRRIEYMGKASYRTVAWGDASEGDTFLETMVPLRALGIPLPSYINVQGFYDTKEKMYDTTKKVNIYVPKQKPSDEELRNRWLFSFGAGGYYGDGMFDNPNLQNFDLLFGFGYSFGGDLYWGLTFNLHAKIGSLTTIYFRNYERPYHFFDIWIMPYDRYTFGYGIGINRLFLRTKFSYSPEDEKGPYSFGIYGGFLFR